jgi:hypothetical protein
MPGRPSAMAPKKAIAKKRKAVAVVPAPAKKAAVAATGGKLEVVIEACKS